MSLVMARVLWLSSQEFALADFVYSLAHMLSPRDRTIGARLQFGDILTPS
jgi:hypothetical protein